MVVTVASPELSYTGRFDWINDGGEGWDLANDSMKLSNVDFDFLKSNDSNYHVTVKRYSFGKTESEAMGRAEKIHYPVSSVDSILDLASGYAIDKDSKFRWQHVVVEIHIPVGKKIRFDRSVNEKLNPGNFDFNDGGRYSRRINRSWRNGESYYSYSRYLHAETDYVMSAEGRLMEPSGHSLDGDGYRYDENENANDSIRIHRDIERKKQELKELEDRQNRRQSSVEYREGQEIAKTNSMTPGFSIIKALL
jgi:hypothetical protein